MGSISGHSRPACIGRLDFYRTDNRFASKIMGLCLGYVARASTNLRGGSSSRPAGSSRSSLAHLVSSLRSPRFRLNRRHWRPPWVDLFIFTEARRILKGQPCGHVSANRVLPHLQKLSVRIYLPPMAASDRNQSQAATRRSSIGSTSCLPCNCSRHRSGIACSP